jgi:hypothetical protein
MRIDVPSEQRERGISPKLSLPRALFGTVFMSFLCTSGRTAFGPGPRLSMATLDGIPTS